MRIVSGKYKGRRIIAPKHFPTRPTTDMAKEALFNILYHRYYLDELSVLDLFSGIGSISLEFASRGATDITSVDHYQGCVSFLSKTSLELDLPIRAVKSDAIRFLEKSTRQFDLIFADPPYELPQESFDQIIQTVFEKSMLCDDGLLIIEHGVKTSLAQHPQFEQQRKYGSNVFSFFNQ